MSRVARGWFLWGRLYIDWPGERCSWWQNVARALSRLGGGS